MLQNLPSAAVVIGALRVNTDMRTTMHAPSMVEFKSGRLAQMHDKWSFSNKAYLY